MGWGPAAPGMTASNTAAAAQSAAAAQQSAIALDQWNTTKEYLPKAQALADAENDRANRAADQATSDSQFYRGVAQHQIDQSAKAEPFQQMQRDTAADYASGKAGNEEAGQANADVEQGYDNAAGSMERSAGRMGLNPGSDGFASALGDMYTSKALAPRLAHGPTTAPRHKPWWLRRPAPARLHSATA